MAQKTRKIRIIRQCLHEGESLFVDGEITLPADEASYLVFTKRGVYVDGGTVESREPVVENRDPRPARK